MNCYESKVDGEIPQLHKQTESITIENAKDISALSDGSPQKLMNSVERSKPTKSYKQSSKEDAINQTDLQSGSFNYLPIDVATSTPNNTNIIEPTHSKENADTEEHNIEPENTNHMKPVDIEPKFYANILQMLQNMFIKFKNDVVKELETIIQSKINTATQDMKEDDQRNMDLLLCQLNEEDNENFNKQNEELRNEIRILKKQNRILTEQLTMKETNNTAAVETQTANMKNSLQKKDENTQWEKFSATLMVNECQHEKLKNKIKAIETSLLKLQNQNIELREIVEILPESALKDMHIQHSKPKLQIFSNNKFNPITSIASEVFKQSFEFCHHIHSNTSTIQLIRAMKEYSANISQDDFCIVMIGERDFSSSENYRKIVDDIRYEINTLKHLKIILCLPTYRCNGYSDMYNWRIESFNNLIYNDNKKHEYAFLIDSNCNLTYNYEMFLTKSGVINNRGIVTILQDIKAFIINRTTTLVQLGHDMPCNNFTKTSTFDAQTNILLKSNADLDESRQFFRE